MTAASGERAVGFACVIASALAFGVMAILARIAYARLTVNGTYYGLYNNIETIDRRFLTRHFSSNRGALYEGTYPLPEAQRDRFMARVSIGYPSPAAELQMLDVHGGASPLGAGAVAAEPCSTLAA